MSGGEYRHDVFISFSTVQQDVAVGIKSYLEGAGVTSWCSAVDVPGGANWDDEVAAALESTAIVLLLLTESANASRHVKNEIVTAGDLELKILPCRIQDFRPTGSLRLQLARSNWIDMFPGEVSDHYPRVLLEVCRALGRPAPPVVVETPGPANGVDTSGGGTEVVTGEDTTVVDGPVIDEGSDTATVVDEVVVEDLPAEKALVCAECGHHNPVTAYWCENCGSDLPDEDDEPIAKGEDGGTEDRGETVPPTEVMGKRCNDCGHLAPADARWCPVCGLENFTLVMGGESGVVEVTGESAGEETAPSPAPAASGEYAAKGRILATGYECRPGTKESDYFRDHPGGFATGQWIDVEIVEGAVGNGGTHGPGEVIRHIHSDGGDVNIVGKPQVGDMVGYQHGTFTLSWVKLEDE